MIVRSDSLVFTYYINQSDMVTFDVNGMITLVKNLLIRRTVKSNVSYGG